MGQYHRPTNWTRKEYIHPHKFDDGLKLLEFGCSGDGTMTGLAILLASSNKGGARGGGDLSHDSSKWYQQRLMDHVVGRWAGEQISIIGDYWDNDNREIFSDDGSNPWNADGTWTDISEAVLQAMALDNYHMRGRALWQTLVNDDGRIVDPLVEEMRCSQCGQINHNKEEVR